MRALPRSQRRLGTRSSRWRQAWRRWVPFADSPDITWEKAERVSAVTLGGARLKHLALTDGERAARLEALTRRAWRVGVAPEPILLDGANLWLDFLDGESVSGNDPGLVQELAALFSSLWSTKSIEGIDRVEVVEESPNRGEWFERLLRDLRWLEDAGILEGRLAAEIATRAEATLPSVLWRGLDYVDLRPANLLRATGRLWIVDVESLCTDFPLGSGIAKASLGWLAPHKQELLETLAKSGAPDLRPSMPFVELCFLAWWQKRCALRGKWKHVEPELFRRSLRA